MIDPTTPVLVGAAQLTSRDRNASVSALGMLTEVAEAALGDTAAPETLRTAVTSVGVTDCLTSELPDMALALADALGISAKRTVGTHTSGTSPIELLRDACAGVSSGELDAALIGGAEVVKAYPDFSAGWARLGERALDAGEVIAAYAYARTGYHRGLDQLRRNGWKGFGPVPWEHEPNQGFLRAVAVLAKAAQQIGEDAEYQRCKDLLDESDPAAAPALGL